MAVSRTALQMPFPKENIRIIILRILGRILLYVVVTALAVMFAMPLL
ncbi:MAG: hypothetical protein H5T71_04170, partial [Chloroflexi bacterium]|nr:hypothetical protein [Chloroflexota bacterium]